MTSIRTLQRRRKNANEARPPGPVRKVSDEAFLKAWKRYTADYETTEAAAATRAAESLGLSVRSLRRYATRILGPIEQGEDHEE